MLELRREATEPRFGYSDNSEESSEVLILHQSSTNGCTSLRSVAFMWKYLVITKKSIARRRAHLRPTLRANVNHVLNGWS